MSIRSMRIPGMMLGLGTFVNSDIDAKRKVIYHGEMTWTGGNYDRTFTQGQTKMATIQCVILGRNFLDDKSSGSCHFTITSISGGTIIVATRNYVSAAATNKRDVKMSFWMVGSPDPNRIIV